jgi:hypothetical protein
MSDPTAQEQLGNTAFELARIVQRDPGACPVCRFVGQGMKQHVDTLFYELVTDVPTRQAIRDARGFCRRHARVVSLQADALGTTLIMEDVLSNDLRDLMGGQYDRPPVIGGSLSQRLAQGIGQIVPGSQARDRRSPCPLCEAEREMDEVAVDGLLQGLGNRDRAEQIRGSAGLCMPHFRLTFERAKESEGWEILLEVQTKALTQLVEQLRKLARTYDHRFRDEARDADPGSWRRALDVTSGVAHD